MKLYIITRSQGGILQQPETYGEKDCGIALNRFRDLCRNRASDEEIRLDVYERKFVWKSFRYLQGNYPMNENGVATDGKPEEPEASER